MRRAEFGCKSEKKAECTPTSGPHAIKIGDVEKQDQVKEDSSIESDEIVFEAANEDSVNYQMQVAKKEQK